MTDEDKSPLTSMIKGAIAQINSAFTDEYIYYARPTGTDGEEYGNRSERMEGADFTDFASALRNEYLGVPLQERYEVFRTASLDDQDRGHLAALNAIHTGQSEDLLDKGDYGETYDNPNLSPLQRFDRVTDLLRAIQAKPELLENRAARREIIKQMQQASMFFSQLARGICEERDAINPDEHVEKKRVIDALQSSPEAQEESRSRREREARERMAQEREMHQAFMAGVQQVHGRVNAALESLGVTPIGKIDIAKYD